ncbi:hypothetical protein [Nocardia sp. XZ_19_231]|nr:hypothetical protein [Nocardia sp. XZ_19_231]
MTDWQPTESAPLSGAEPHAVVLLEAVAWQRNHPGDGEGPVVRVGKAG